MNINVTEKFKKKKKKTMVFLNYLTNITTNILTFTEIHLDIVLLYIHSQFASGLYLLKILPHSKPKSTKK